MLRPGLVALQSADLGKLRRVAHAMSGGAATVGAVRLRWVARMIETYCEVGDAPALEKLTLSIPEVAAETMTHLRAYVADEMKSAAA